jgi:hypothetical protein
VIRHDGGGGGGGSSSSSSSSSNDDNNNNNNNNNQKNNTSARICRHVYDLANSNVFITYRHRFGSQGTIFISHYVADLLSTINKFAFFEHLSSNTIIGLYIMWSYCHS